MAGRLFFGNFDFEHFLADPGWSTKLKLSRLNAELATAWLAVAEEGDLIWAPLPIPQEFLERMHACGLPNVVCVCTYCKIPDDMECIPWGWSWEIRELIEMYGWVANAPSDQAVRLANSRSTSFELERQSGTGLQWSRRIESMDELRAAIRGMPESQRWVVKAEFGMSARERIIGRGAVQNSHENWMHNRLNLQGCGAVFFEPWVERISEIGIQIEVPRQGPVQLMGITPMVVNRQGQYAGSWFSYSQTRFALDRSMWDQAVETALWAGRHLQSIGYFGPVGIDAMIYRELDGTVKIRPLQDINARWTMGRLSLGWRQLLGPNEEGYWQHGNQNAIEWHPVQQVAKEISTSPPMVGMWPCQHFSRILIPKH